MVPIVMFVFRRVLTLDTPMGRKFRAQSIHHGKPLVRTKMSDQLSAGVQRVARIARVRNGLPITVDGDPAPAADGRLVHRIPARLQLD